MKKTVAVFLVLVAVFAIGLPAAFAAAKTQREADGVEYYDENGNPITVDGVYYNTDGFPCFNAECYYLDDDGEPVYVGGCRAYYYGKDGDLTPGRYCYDAEGDAIAPPASYRGGCGYGTWCYGADGAVEDGSFYYDDFGNQVDPPARSAPGYYGRGGGGCCGNRGGRWS